MTQSFYAMWHSKNKNSKIKIKQIKQLFLISFITFRIKLEPKNTGVTMHNTCKVRSSNPEH